MARNSGQWRVAWMMVVMLGLLVVAPMASAAPPSDEARARCQGDGYLSVATTGGQVFKNAGQCMKHVAQGGTLVAAPQIIRAFHIPFATELGAWCESFFDLHNFPASTAVHVVVDGYISPEYNPQERDVVTDSSGFAYAAGMSVRVGTTTVSATYTAPAGGVVTVVETFPCQV